MNDLKPESAELLGFLYACPVGLAEITSDGSIGMINPMAMQLLIPLVRTSTFNFFEMMDAYAPDLRNLVEYFPSPQGAICEDRRILIHPEQLGEVDSRVFACTLIKLGPERFMVSLSDVSKQVKQERKLKEAETWFSSLLDGVNEFGVASLDATGRIESVNASVPRQTGYEPDHLIGQTLEVFGAAEISIDSLTAAEQIAIASRDGWHLNENWQQRKDGTNFWCQRLIAVRSVKEELSEGDISGYTVIFREGQQRAVDIHRLKQMLTRDHLTGAYNRMHFFEIAEKEFARRRRYGQALSLVAIDVDRFKQVNDRYGHVIGDAVLKGFAHRCMSPLRPMDTMARIGGEEFVILLPSTTAVGAAQLAERLRENLASTPIQALDTEIPITGSFGCAELHSGSSTLTELMNAADKALYEAKHTGRNRVVLGQDVT